MDQTPSRRCVPTVSLPRRARPVVEDSNAMCWRFAEDHPHFRIWEHCHVLEATDHHTRNYSYRTYHILYIINMLNSVATLEFIYTSVLLVTYQRVMPGAHYNDR